MIDFSLDVSISGTTLKIRRFYETWSPDEICNVKLKEILILCPKVESARVHNASAKSIHRNKKSFRSYEISKRCCLSTCNKTCHLVHTSVPKAVQFLFAIHDVKFLEVNSCCNVIQNTTFLKIFKKRNISLVLCFTCLLFIGYTFRYCIISYFC